MDTSILRTWAEVDYGAIAHNVEEIRKLVGQTEIIGICKANAYGHGALECVQALQNAGVHLFAVATLGEARELRQGGVEDPILILSYTPPAQFADLVEGDFLQTILSWPYALKLAEFGQSIGRPMKGHLKIDTGMNRTGILYEDNARCYDRIKAVYGLEGLEVQGIFSHFPVSDDLGFECRTFTRHQMELFNELIGRLREEGIDPGVTHIQNSYGILNYKNSGYDYCRPGLLYMGVTSDDSIPIASSPDFIPILSLKTKVTMVKNIPAGATVSYGRHFMAEKSRRIASLAVGYADGLPRECSNKNLMVSIREHLVPLVGNICMDQCMADITGYDDIQEGDVVTIIGRDGANNLTVDEISRKAGTINNETLTRLTSRVPRIRIQ